MNPDKVVVDTAKHDLVEELMIKQIETSMTEMPGIHILSMYVMHAHNTCVCHS